MVRISNHNRTREYPLAGGQFCERAMAIIESGSMVRSRDRRGCPWLKRPFKNDERPNYSRDEAVTARKAISLRLGQIFRVAIFANLIDVVADILKRLGILGVGRLERSRSLRGQRLGELRPIWIGLRSRGHQQ